MGQLIDLAEHRRKRTAAVSVTLPSGFYYDLTCPFSYLAGERIERLLGEAAWHPAPNPRNGAGARPAACADAGPSRTVRSDAERAAAALRLPLSWPERFGSDSTGLHRAAVCAAGYGAGARFALAALRLGFCGGFDLSDPAIIIEAAAAAGVPMEHCLDAAIDPAFDGPLDDANRILGGASVRERPAIKIGQRYFDGRHAVIEATALRAEWQRVTTRPAS
jgi:2-hydroxychromene-2-carboxylate isomerase